MIVQYISRHQGELLLHKSDYDTRVSYCDMTVVYFYRPNRSWTSIKYFHSAQGGCLSFCQALVIFHPYVKKHLAGNPKKDAASMTLSKVLNWLPNKAFN